MLNDMAEQRISAIRATGADVPAPAAGDADVDGSRGNKRPGVVALILMAGIFAALLIVVYVAILGFRKEPDGPIRGSGALPAQAAQGAGTKPVETGSPKLR
jgi:hypothetical protein